MYAPPIENLIRAFSRLPTVGRRTAERFVFHLLKSGKKPAAELALSLKELIDEVKSCEMCFTFSDKSPCDLCADTRRDRTTVCVVAEPQDMRAIEKTGVFSGMYHILRGVIRPDEVGQDTVLKVSELAARVRSGDVSEVVLALNPNMEGETTMLYLERELKAACPSLRVARLARGLPMGSDVQYADEITLGSALKNRTTI